MNSFKNINKNINGITMISLVITTVVMLLLAGVVISISVDEQNLFDKTQEASKLQTRSLEFEALKSIQLNMTLENMGTVLINNLKQAFEYCGFVETVTYKDENTLGVRTINNNVFEFSGGVLRFVGEGTAHVGGIATCTEAPICTMCGESYGEPLGHEIPDNYESDETHHWKLCSRGCGEYVIAKEPHSEGSASCTGDATCLVCSTITQTALGHIEPEEYDTDGTNHWKLCDRGCGEYIVEKTAHSGGTATCTAVAKCTVCNIGYGSKNSSNHSGTKNRTGCTYYKWSCCGYDSGYTSHNYPCSGANHKRSGGSVTIKCSRCSATKKYTVTNGTCTYWSCSCGTSGGGANSHTYTYSCSKSGHTIYSCLCSKCSYCGSCGKYH